MATLFRLCFVLLLFTAVTMHRADAFLRKYVSMILDLHDFHKTSSVCFVMPRKNQNLFEHTLATVLTREFSQRGVLTSVVYNEATKERTSKCRNGVVRPLIVVLLTTLEEVYDFAEEVRGTKKALTTWLLIFTSDFSPSVCEYCENPMENTLGLRFDTEMLVSCCEDPSLREWWTIRGNETRTASFAKWTVENGLEINTYESLYARRPSIKGTPFRIAYVRNSAFRKIENGTYGGFFNGLLLELKRVMHFEITAIRESKGFGSWSPTTRNWSGTVQLVKEAEADLGAAEFSMTIHRLSAVDYTLPFMMTQLKLYVRAHDSSGVQWSAHFKAFAYQIWLTIIVLVITSTLLVSAMKRRTGLNSFPYLILEHYLYVWGIFCQQGLAVFPAETSLRIAYSSIFVSALVVSAAYSAALISFITVSTATLPFSSLLEFVNDGSYRLVVLQDSADWNIFDLSTDPVMREMKKMMKPTKELPETMDDGFKQLCAEKVAFFTSEVMAKTSHKHFPCKVGQIDTGAVDSLAMILPAGSQFTGVVNYHIQRFQDNGIINRLKDKYMQNPSEPESTPMEVTLPGVAPILSVLAGGIILSLLLLFCENVCKPRARKARTWPTTYSRGFHSRTMRNRKFLINVHRKQTTTYLP